MESSDKCIKNNNCWVIIDDCEYFIAKCSNCGYIKDSRLLPHKCPKCLSVMLNGNKPVDV